jgi:hypothetical protein
MKRILSLILLFQINTIFAQNNKSLIGTYYSINNDFERWSIMDLTSDGKFIYSYGIGGCQAQVTGVYKIRNNKLIFKNDPEFTKQHLDSINQEIVIDDSTTINLPQPIYPDLSLVEWNVKKRYIKPTKPVDSGCIVESGKHKKRIKTSHNN